MTSEAMLANAAQYLERARKFLIDAHWVGHEWERDLYSYTPDSRDVTTLALLMGVLDQTGKSGDVAER